jgi:hypothetical protein
VENKKDSIISDYLKLMMISNGIAWSKQVKLAVAGNPETPPDILDILSEDPDTDVKSKVARNPNSSLGTLARLLKCKAWIVVNNVTNHPKFPRPDDPDREEKMKEIEYLKHLR